MLNLSISNRFLTTLLFQIVFNLSHICFSTILGTNSLNSADVPLIIKQIIFCISSAFSFFTTFSFSPSFSFLGGGVGDAIDLPMHRWRNIFAKWRHLACGTNRNGLYAVYFPWFIKTSCSRIYKGL